VRQKDALRALASTLAHNPVVWRIQERQPERFNPTMHLKAVAMDQLIDNGRGLCCTIRIQLDPVSARARLVGNRQERSPVPDAGINRGERRRWVAQTSPDSTRFGKGQREVPEPELSLIPHECTFLVAALTYSSAEIRRCYTNVGIMDGDG
jgi:hypothetical protein